MCNCGAATVQNSSEDQQLTVPLYGSQKLALMSIKKS